MCSCTASAIEVSVFRAKSLKNIGTFKLKVEPQKGDRINLWIDGKRSSFEVVSREIGENYLQVIVK